MRVLFFFLAITLISIGCNNDTLDLESRFVLLAKNAISYSTSKDGEKIAYFDSVLGKTIFINNSSGDTTQLDNWFRLNFRLSAYGDSILFADNGGELKFYDLINDSIYSLFKYEDGELYIMDWGGEQNDRVLIFLHSDVGSKLIAYDLIENTTVSEIGLNAKGMSVFFSKASFNQNESIIAYNDVVNDNDWSINLYELSSEKTRIIPGENFIGWVDEPYGIISAKNTNGKIFPIFIPMEDTQKRINLDVQISLPGRVGSKNNGLPNFWISELEQKKYIDILSILEDSLVIKTSMNLNFADQSKSSWTTSNTGFYFATGEGIPGDYFTINKYEDAKNIELLKLESVYRFGSHAFNPEFSPSGEKVLFQGRPLFDTLALNNGIFIYNIENGFSRFLPSKERCPTICLEWPTWLNENELLFTKWTDNWPERSIILYNLNLENDTVVLEPRDNTGIAHLSAAPDGAKVAFISWSTNRKENELKVLDLLSGKEVTLLNFDTLAYYGYGQPIFEITWSKKSDEIYYAMNKMGSQNKISIGKVSLKGKTKIIYEEVSNLYPYGLDLSTDGKKLLLTKGEFIKEHTYQLYVDNKK